MTAPARLLDVGEIARMLDHQADSVARELLPDGQKRSHEWVARCPWRADRSLGSFSVHIGGAKSGLWCDFVTNDHGDMLDLVARVLFGGQKTAAIEWAKRRLGLVDGDPNAIERVRRATPSPEMIAELESKEAAERRELAFRLWMKAAPSILDTPVDTYLRGRGIPLKEMGHSPRAIRFHPALYHSLSDRKWPAMITHVAGPDGAFCAAHRTYLEVHTDGRVTKAPVERPKMVLGNYRGGSIRLWKGTNRREFKKMEPGETVDITEGIEDGLSVAYACPEHRVLAAISLSNMGGLELPPAATAVRIWRQNDTAPAAIIAFRRAVEAHIAAGRQVLIPPMPANIKDANDLLCVGEA